MKAKELIEQLQQFHPDVEVVYNYPDNGCLECGASGRGENWDGDIETVKLETENLYRKRAHKLIIRLGSL